MKVYGINTTPTKNFVGAMHTTQYLFVFLQECFVSEMARSVVSSTGLAGGD